MAKVRCQAVGLLSGGLDSALAAAVLKGQGIEVHAVFIEMPWGCGKSGRVRAVAEELGVPLKVILLGDDYLEILRNPRFGFGSAFNPCIDCHIYMIRQAAGYMRELGAEFVFTGEVLGQRPMSQRFQALQCVEKEAGIPGRLLRPLSAAFLEPTLPEQQGLVDRSRLPAIEGRSRKVQYDLARRLGVTSFAQPGGGCLLTEKHFGARIKDVLSRGCEYIQATAVLGLGRYFRLDERTFVIVGRDERENAKLQSYAVSGDVLFRSETFPGPVALLRGDDSAETLAQAAGLVQYHSKLRGQPPAEVVCWRNGPVSERRTVQAAELAYEQVNGWLI
ncbi:MAG: hypothetical protein HGA80_00785 [Candidatus Omnitrophica bacterium]|nr:hypothetical protein [Candidatus Omnitrophota bacterium]